MVKKRIKPKRTNEEELEATAGEAQPDQARAEEELADDAERRLQEMSAELEETRKLSEETRDKHLRALAELDNFRKRSRVEVQEAARRATEDVIVSVLAVVDNLERAIDSANDSSDSDALLEGVKLTLKQCHEALAKFGVEPIEAVGCEFDPGVHEAVMQIPASDDDDGKVVGEVQKGYKMGDRVIRAAMVQVGKATEEAEAASAEG